MATAETFFRPGGSAPGENSRDASGAGSLFGGLRLYARGGALVSLRMGAEPSDAPAAPPDEPCLAQAASWLEAYFSTRGIGRPSLDMPPLAPAGTPFQQRVWQALLRVPFGETQSYGELARILGTSPRAVGGALRANPLPLFIPCHRITAASALGGYAGASALGQARKRWLLEHERAP